MKTNLKVDQQSGFVQHEGFPGCVAVSARTGKVPRNLGSSWSPYVTSDVAAINFLRTRVAH